MVRFQCPAYPDACGYITVEVKFEHAMKLLQMHIDIDHAADDVNNIDEAAEAEVVNTIDKAVEEKVVYTIDEAVKDEDVNGEVTYLEFEDVQQKLDKLTRRMCTWRDACGYIGEEIVEAVEVVRQKPGSKSAKRRQRMQDAKRRRHNLATMAPTRLTCPPSTDCGYITEEVDGEIMYMGLFGYTLEDGRKRQLQQYGVSSPKQKRDEVPLQQREEIPTQHQQRDVVTIQHKRGEEVPDQLHHEQGEEVPGQQHYK